MELLGGSRQRQCPLCGEDIKDDFGNPDSCQHAFHVECLRNWAQTVCSARARTVECPMEECKSKFTAIQVRSRPRGKVHRSIVLNTPCDSAVHESEKDSVVEECPICQEAMRGEVAAPESCDHHFCRECLLEWCRTSHTCPMDRQKFSLIFLKTAINGEITRRMRAPRCTRDLEREAQIEADREAAAEVEVVTRGWQLLLDDSDEESDIEWLPTCTVCNEPGEELALCSRCGRAYHLGCHAEPLRTVPRGEWTCFDCLEIEAVVLLGQSPRNRSQQRLSYAQLRSQVRMAVRQHRRDHNYLGMYLNSSEEDDTDSESYEGQDTSSSSGDEERRGRRRLIERLWSSSDGTDSDTDGTDVEIDGEKPRRTTRSSVTRSEDSNDSQPLPGLESVLATVAAGGGDIPQRLMSLPSSDGAGTSYSRAPPAKRARKSTNGSTRRGASNTTRRKSTSNRKNSRKRKTKRSSRRTSQQKAADLIPVSHRRLAARMGSRVLPPTVARPPGASPVMVTAPRVETAPSVLCLMGEGNPLHLLVADEESDEPVSSAVPPEPRRTGGSVLDTLLDSQSVLLTGSGVTQSDGSLVILPRHSQSNDNLSDRYCELPVKVSASSIAPVVTPAPSPPAAPVQNSSPPRVTRSELSYGEYKRLRDQKKDVPVSSSSSSSSTAYVPPPMPTVEQVEHRFHDNMDNDIVRRGSGDTDSEWRARVRSELKAAGLRENFRRGNVTRENYKIIMQRAVAKLERRDTLHLSKLGRLVNRYCQHYRKRGAAATVTSPASLASNGT